MGSRKTKHIAPPRPVCRMTGLGSLEFKSKPPSIQAKTKNVIHGIQ